METVIKDSQPLSRSNPENAIVPTSSNSSFFSTSSSTSEAKKRSKSEKKEKKEKKEKEKKEKKHKKSRKDEKKDINENGSSKGFGFFKSKSSGKELGCNDHNL